MKYVYVIDAENKAQYRRVTTGALQQDGLRVITDGLKPGEWVAVGALQQIRPNVQVQTEEDLHAEPWPELAARRTAIRASKLCPWRDPLVSHFFIDRPIFATVLSIVITLAGGIAVFSLPIAQYPPISPPQVQVAINYPGASAQVVADTVAAPIEQQVNGVPGMLYMTSLSGNDGTYTLFVTFDVGVNLNTALVMVQNRVQLAMPLLPTSVQNQGITIRKKTPDILMVISLYSPDDRYDDLYLSNFATINLYDPLLRVDGVSDISILGERDYSMPRLARPAEAGLAQHERRGRGRPRSPTKTCRRPPGRSGNRRRAGNRPSTCRSTRWAGLLHRSSSATSSSRSVTRRPMTRPRRKPPVVVGSGVRLQPTAGIAHSV